MKNYAFLFIHFSDEFGDRELESITPDDILSFLTKITDGNKQTTKRNRYSSLKAFFNFIKNSIDTNIQNPCDTPILRKIFKDSKSPPWPIIEKVTYGPLDYWLIYEELLDIEAACHGKLAQMLPEHCIILL